MTQPPRDPALLVADRELRAARAIILDPASDDEPAAPHLAAAWEALARASLGRAPDPAAPPTIAAWLSPADRDRLGPRAAAEADAILAASLDLRGRAAAADARWPLPHAALERHCDAVDRLLRAHLGPRPIARGRLLRLGLGALALVALALLALRPWQRAGAGPWVAAYYGARDFSGAPVIRREREINFKWGPGSPVDTIAGDRFSARFSTCLTLETDIEAAFQLISDDASRLYVDGALVVNNWGVHERRARGATIDLKAGVHLLVVEYYEDRYDASLTFAASLDGDTPRALPDRVLRAPDDPDAEDPCGRSSG